MKKTLFGALSLTVSAAVFAGQTTPVPDVAPVAKGQQVVINIPQQRLFLYEDGILQKVYRCCGQSDDANQFGSAQNRREGV